MKDRRVAVAALGGVITVFVVMAIAASFTDYFPGDPTVMRWAQRVGWFEPVARFFNVTVDDWIIRIAAGVFVAVLLLFRQWPFALAWTATWFAPVLSLTTKEWVDRPRPAGDFQIHISTDTQSFPSGHAFNAAIFATFVALTALRWLPPQLATLIAIACVAFAFIAGFARFWLGVHWLSDAVGGWILGAWCAGVAWLAAEYVNDWREARSLRSVNAGEAGRVR